MKESNFLFKLFYNFTLLKVSGNSPLNYEREVWVWKEAVRFLLEMSRRVSVGMEQYQFLSN